MPLPKTVDELTGEDYLRIAHYTARKMAPEHLKEDAASAIVVNLLNKVKTSFDPKLGKLEQFMFIGAKHAAKDFLRRERHNEQGMHRQRKGLSTPPPRYRITQDVYEEAINDTRTFLADKTLIPQDVAIDLQRQIHLRMTRPPERIKISKAARRGNMPDPRKADFPW